jgi:hypothetical protein
MSYSLKRSEENENEWLVIDETGKTIEGPYHRRDAENALDRLERNERDCMSASDYWDERYWMHWYYWDWDENEI